MRTPHITPANIRRMLPTTEARMESATFEQRANTALDVATGSGSAALLLYKHAGQIESYVLTAPGTDANRAGFQIAQAVGARSAKVAEDDLPDIAGADIVRAEADRDPMVGKSMQVGVDAMQLAQIAATNLGDGDWIAITFRRRTGREQRQWNKWVLANVEGNGTSHHSRSANAVVFSAMAGSKTGYSTAESSLTAILAGMPGFDTSIRARKARDGRHAVAPALLTALFAVLAVFVPSALSDTAVVASPLRILLWLATAACALFCLARILDLLPHPDRRLAVHADGLVFDPPEKHRGRVRPPKRERVERDTGKVIPEFKGDYPLARTSFMAAPSVFTSLVAPATGASAGQSESRSRPVPPVLSTRVGPLIGHSPDEKATAVCLVADALRFGIGILGQPGSGKTQLVRSLFGWALLEKTRPSNLPGAPGARNANIAIENKGPDGAAQYLAWGQALGAEVTAFELTDPATPAIDFFASGATTPEGQANDFVDAMVYAWSETEIGNRARDGLTRTIEAGIVIAENPAVVAEANAGLEPGEDRIPAGRSAIAYAHILCGGGPGGDQMGVRLASAVRACAPDNPDTADALGQATWAASRRLDRLYRGTTERQRRDLLDSSVNKTVRLASLEDWFSPARPKATWRQILTGHRDVVLNLGQSISGRTVDDFNTEKMSAIAMFTLKQAIARTCTGWAEANRWVSVYADELSLIAGASPEVMTWMRDQGRAFGVRAVFATQRPRQLADPVRQMLLGMETLVAFQQADPQVIAEIVADLNLDGTGWTDQDIAQLPKYTAAIRTSGVAGRLAAFLCRIKYFEADRSAFAGLQAAA